MRKGYSNTHGNGKVVAKLFLCRAYRRLRVLTTLFFKINRVQIVNLTSAWHASVIVTCDSKTRKVNELTRIVDAICLILELVWNSSISSYCCSSWLSTLHTHRNSCAVGLGTYSSIYSRKKWIIPPAVDRSSSKHGGASRISVAQSTRDLVKNILSFGWRQCNLKCGSQRRASTLVKPPSSSVDASSGVGGMFRIVFEARDVSARPDLNNEWHHASLSRLLFTWCIHFGAWQSLCEILLHPLLQFLRRGNGESVSLGRRCRKAALPATL